MRDFVSRARSGFSRRQYRRDVDRTDLLCRKRARLPVEPRFPQRPHQHAVARAEGRMTMSNFSVFDISGRAMSAQLVRLNTTASNLANAGTVEIGRASCRERVCQYG